MSKHSRSLNILMIWLAAQLFSSCSTAPQEEQNRAYSSSKGKESIDSVDSTASDTDDESSGASLGGTPKTSPIAANSSKTKSTGTNSGTTISGSSISSSSASSSSSSAPSSSSSSSAKSNVNQVSASTKIKKNSTNEPPILPAEQEALVVTSGVGVSYTLGQECDGQFKGRQSGDLCAYDFCGSNNGHLNPDVQHTVTELKNYFVSKNLVPNPCVQKTVVNALRNQLEELDLSGKMIKDISPLMEMKSLKKLSLDNNLIEGGLGELVFMKKLQYLSVRNNKLTSVQGLAGSQTLLQAYFAKNYLSSIDPLVSVTTLTKLDISYNNRMTSIIGFLQDPRRVNKPVELYVVGDEHIITEVIPKRTLRSPGADCDVLHTQRSGADVIDGEAPSCLLGNTINMGTDLTGLAASALFGN